MTEREILKKLVRIVDSGLGLEGDIKTILNTEARKVLASTADPEPEHPAVEAYRKWRDSGNLHCNTLSEPFLAGWKQALQWASARLNVSDNVHYQFEENAAATPTQLP